MIIRASRAFHRGCVTDVGYYCGEFVHVRPILVPSLKERRDDIPVLGPAILFADFNILRGSAAAVSRDCAGWNVL